MAKQNGSSPFTDNQLARLVKDSASQVGAGGSFLFGGLAKLGGSLDREAKSRVFEARNAATEIWERVETAFVHRVARALNALQIPTARDVKELNERVAELQKAVVLLERRAAEAAAAAATKQAAPRARRATAKKTKTATGARRKKAGS